MKRHAMNYAHLVILIASPAALGQTAEWDRAWSFRESAWGSPTDLAALAVSAEVQDQLAEEVRDYLATSPADAGLTDALASAQEQVTADVSWGRDPQAAYDAGRIARAEVIEEFDSLFDDAQEILPVSLRGYVDTAIANGGLDSPYRLLDLTDGQSQALVEFQNQRDAVLLDARQWHRPARLEAARAAFQVQAPLLLTRVQQAELAQFQANIAANLEAVLDRELADYPQEDDASDRSAKQREPKGSGHKYMAAKLRSAANEVWRVLRTYAPGASRAAVVRASQGEAGRESGPGGR